MSEHVNCFVFRTANDSFVRQELQKGRLCQGWSPPGTSLLDAARHVPGKHGKMHTGMRGERTLALDGTGYCAVCWL